MRAGVTCVPLSLGVRGIGTGLSLAAETRQQGTLESAELTVADVDCLLIIGQRGVHFFGVMCSQHEPTAMAGVASKIIASIEATNLERRVTVTEEIVSGAVWRDCDRGHRGACQVSLACGRSSCR